MSFSITQPINSNINKPIYNAGKINDVPVSFEVMNGKSITGPIGSPDLNRIQLQVTDGNYFYLGTGIADINGYGAYVTLPYNPPFGYYITIIRGSGINIGDWDIQVTAPSGTIINNGGSYEPSVPVSKLFGQLNSLTFLYTSLQHEGQNVWVISSIGI